MGIPVKMAHVQISPVFDRCEYEGIWGNGGSCPMWTKMTPDLGWYQGVVREVSLELAHEAGVLQSSDSHQQGVSRVERSPNLHSRGCRCLW